MSVSVDLLFKEIGLEYSKPYRWNEKLDANINGVYVISTSNNPFISESKIELNICEEAFNNWINEAPNLEIENKKVISVNQVSQYLLKFWDDRGNILYIGESSSKTNPIQKRVNQFYTHKIGKKGPHTGGYWIKLLSCIEDLYIYFAESSNPRETEFKMIMKYVEIKSGKNMFELENIVDYFPFANSKVDLLKANTIKNHINDNKRKNLYQGS
jgi:hypothetical protein